VSSFLETILQHKKAEVAALRRDCAALEPLSPVPPHREFRNALENGPQLNIIAEVKKASPSKGVIRPDFDPVAIAQTYEKAGENAISVLTDERFFMGHASYLLAVRDTVKLPVLRKDFIIDPLQVEQSAALGADAVLLIVAALGDGQLCELADAAASFCIETLVEVHDPWELERAMRISPRILGINNRNLSTFVTDVNTSIDLVRRIPQDITVVSESGIESEEQARALRSAGIKAILVGESLMRLENPADLVAKLRG